MAAAYSTLRAFRPCVGGQAEPVKTCQRPIRLNHPSGAPWRDAAASSDYFPGGFADATYLDWERDYKWQAYLRWKKELDATTFRQLIKATSYQEVAHRAVRIESGTNLLFSFETMALRDAVKARASSRTRSTRFYMGLAP